ncbi:hypothetical protein Q2T41_12740 [Maribacter confluentis]|uniref:Addiction module toxin RelE n=1 Tax=Maribacter confluentis TaxID=1656093 RepID=A0ABT8RSE2_9FLAO|nr:hypothetical protein [Maribacter confluentis]MDO1513523.1 hypothetical protein [Maribacter confluentis]
MDRKIEKINTDKLKESIPELRNSSVEIYIDAENSKDKREIEKQLGFAGRSRINTIFGCILRCDYINSIYKREAKGVAAIKIKGGKSKNQNIRIYCKEIFANGKKVVLITSFVKKVQKNVDSQQIQNIISKIQSLEYKF